MDVGWLVKQLSYVAGNKEKLVRDVQLIEYFLKEGSPHGNSAVDGFDEAIVGALSERDEEQIAGRARGFRRGSAG